MEAHLKIHKKNIESPCESALGPKFMKEKKYLSDINNLNLSVLEGFDNKLVKKPLDKMDINWFQQSSKYS